MVHYEHSHMCLGGICMHFAGYILRNGSVGAQSRQINFDKTVQHFTKVFVPMYIASAVCESSIGSVSLPNTVFLFHFNLFGECDMVSSCGFASTFTFLQSIP